MAEVIAAIVGVVLGTVVTWWISRYRPHYILCEEAFRVRLAVGKSLGAKSLSWTSTEKGLLALDVDIGVPYTEVRVKDTPVETLVVQRLKLRNVGQKLIAEPEVHVQLGQTATILGCDVYSDFELSHSEAEGDSVVSLEPLTPQQSVPCPTIIDRNQVTVTLKPLYPYKANRQVVILDIICAGDTGTPVVQGQGVFQEDQSVWTVKFEPWELSRARIQRRVRIFNNVSTVGLFFAIIAFLVWRPPIGILTISTASAVRWASHPLAIAMISALLVYFCYAMYMGMRGWSLSLPLPSLKRKMVVYFARARKKTK